MDATKIISLIESGMFVVFTFVLILGAVGVIVIRWKKKKALEEKAGANKAYDDLPYLQRRERERGDEIYDGETVKSYNDSDYSD